MKKTLGGLFAVGLAGGLLAYGVSEEIPIGRLSGRVIMKENGKPLPGALVTVTLVSQKDDDRPQVKGVETDEEGNFSFKNIPAGDYTLDVSGREHESPAIRITVREGKSTEKKLVAEPNAPYLNLYASQKVFTPGETPRVELHGFTTKGEVAMKIRRVDVDEIAEKGGYQSALSPLTAATADASRELDRISQPVLQSEKVDVKRDAEGAFIQQLPIPSLKAGVYFVTCSAVGQKASTVLLVSDLALITKTGRDGTLAYTTDLQTGKPVSGVQVYAREGSQLRVAATTGADGTARLEALSGDNQALLMARKDDSVALVGFYNSSNRRSDIWIDAYCERPAYRPGDTVQFKGFVRRIAGEYYQLPGPGTVDITVNDPDGNELQTLNLPLSAHGSFNGSFTTSKEGKPGGYNLICKTMGGESSSVYANVVAYRKPEFSIEVKPSTEKLVIGDDGTATVECRYYYGGPVVGAKVKATIYRSPLYTYASEDEDGESYQESYGGGGEYGEEVEAVTDAAGRAKIKFGTRADDDPEVYTNDFRYTIYASVTEDGGRYFDGEGSLTATRGDIGLQFDVTTPIVSVGENARLSLHTTDPLDRSKPIGNRTVTIQAGRERWTKYTSVFVPLQNYSVTTNAQGNATLDVPVNRAESITFRAFARDTEGRTVRAEGWAYVVGSALEANAEQPSIRLTLDKKSYKEGDQARLLINTEKPGGSALVCLQTDRVLWQKVVPLDSPSAMIELPVKRDYAPNVYVSVAYVNEKRFLSSERRLRVNREDRSLKVEVKPEKTSYLPGETAKVTIRTVDADGKPVPTEVSLGVVDRGIYDIASDNTNLYDSLYPERYNQVTTSYSFPEIYLDGGDKGSSNVPIRKNFRDTADWIPSVWTGAAGETTVEVRLPDNLTEWRLTAIGLSDTSQAGMSTSSFTVRKPLMVRLGLPQFLVKGDRQRLTAVVTNDTGADANVDIELGTQGLAFEGEARRTIRVPADAPQTVEFNVTADQAGSATVRATAQTSGASDGVEQQFPVLAHGREVLYTRVGEGNRSYEIQMPKDLDPQIGELTVTLSPTLAGDLVGTLDSLITYPYGCVEQTISRFVPAVLVEKTVRELGLPRPENLKELPNIVRDSLSRLAVMHHSDGGWGWWQYDESEPFMTALVLDGLDRAKRAGYDVSPANPERAVEWSKNFFKDPKRVKEATEREKLYLAYVLLRWGHPEAAKVLSSINLKDRKVEVYPDSTIYEQRPTAADLATAILAYHEAGRNTDALLTRLKKKAQIGEEVATWLPEDQAWGEESSALALAAFMTARPDDPVVPQIVRGLLSKRTLSGWSSTRDTNYALIGLNAYLARTRELSTPSSATLLVNGVEKGTFALDPTTSEPAKTVKVPLKILGSGPIQVEVKTNGEGKCYTSLALRGFEAAKVLEAKHTDPEVTIERRTYKMEARRDSKGELRLLPSEAPVTSFSNGDILRVELTIRAKQPREFVLVDEPTPSSCRVTERTELEPYEEKTWWWSQTELYDDHLAFFARRVPKGESKIVYHMRAEAAGRAVALPAQAGNMYDPGRWASTAETAVEIAK